MPPVYYLTRLLCFGSWGLGRFGTENPIIVRVYRCSIVLIRLPERPPLAPQKGLREREAIAA